MNIAALTAIRTVLGPMTSEAKCREVYEAVLLSVREPGEAVIDAVFELTADPCWPEDAAKAFAAGIDALLAE